MRARLSSLLLAIGVMPLTHVAAHHSPAMLYDLTMEITVTGVVTEFQLGNPHCGSISTSTTKARPKNGSQRAARERS